MRAALPPSCRDRPRNPRLRGNRFHQRPRPPRRGRRHRRGTRDLRRNPTRRTRHAGPAVDVAAVPGTVVFRVAAPRGRAGRTLAGTDLLRGAGGRRGRGTRPRAGRRGSNGPTTCCSSGRKVAGILVECHHRQTPGFVVIGIGLNVLQRAEDFDPELRDRAASLAMMLRRHPLPWTATASPLPCWNGWRALFPLAGAIFPGSWLIATHRGCMPPIASRQNKRRLHFRNRLLKTRRVWPA